MKTLSELRQYVSNVKDAPVKYKIAVGSLIFRDDDRVVLLERGNKARDEQGKLEGVGGGLDNEQDLHKALLREVNEELGEDVKINIEKLLTVMILPGEKDPYWVVPVYLCRLVSGTPKIMEPEKCTQIHYLKIEEIENGKLSRFQKETMRVYHEEFGEEPFYKKVGEKMK